MISVWSQGPASLFPPLSLLRAGQIITYLDFTLTALPLYCTEGEPWCV